MRCLILLFLGLLVISFGFSTTQDIDFVKMPEHSRNDSPVIAFTNDGTLWLAWSSYQNGHSRLAVCSRKSHRWTSIEYPDASLFDQIEPHWAIGPNQKPSLIYTVYDGRQWTICQVDRGKRGWEKPRVLGQGIRPTVSIFGNQKWVAWDNDGQIIIREDRSSEIKSQPIVLKPEKPLIAYSHPQLNSGPGGEMWLAWTASQYGYQSVLLKRIDKENHPVLVVDGGSGVNRNPRISLDKEGRVWIVYEALKRDLNLSRNTMKEEDGSIYLLDRSFRVENPSQVVVVTDGKEWWRPVEPANPAYGLMPNIHCSINGMVWLLSRSFYGISRPFKEFFPLCESLGPDGWKNYSMPWLEQRGYKEVLPMAEDPNSEAWTAWVPNNRKGLGIRVSPSWTFLDGTDSIAVAPMPQVDDLGSPKLISLQREKISLPEPVAYACYQTTYNGEDFQVYFGDLHQHSEFSRCGLRNGWIDQNQHYTRHVRGLDFMCTIDHAEHLNDHNWHVIQMAAEKNNKPGKFVTFTGFEWTSEFDGGGNLYRGHYNAIFRNVGHGDYYFSASDPRYNTPLEFWEALKKAVGGAENVLTIPHHISRRVAWLSWNYYDPEMVPLIEIAQSRGSYEYEGCFSHQIHHNDCTRVRGHYVHDGLKRGMRWGFMASGDHGGRQLVAVFSPKLERDALFQNLKNRRVYATNGERMYLDVRINGHFMGEEFILDGEERNIVVNASGTTPLIQIDLFRNGRIIRQQNLDQQNFKMEWTDREPLFQRENYYYIRAIQKDGGQAWSSPIWVINPETNGRFRFQVGGDELRIIYPDQETDFAILMHNETDEAVRGTVFIDVPDEWNVKEKNGIEIECPPGTWRHAIFHVTVPPSVMSGLSLPKVNSIFEFSDGDTVESSLFVVGSQEPLSREQKAVLIDARTEIPKGKYVDYLEKIAKDWEK